MKINWVERIRNPIFWVNTILAIAMPIIAYYGMSAKDFTTWDSIFKVILDALKNPYVVGLVIVSLWNNIINPVTKGITD
nr:phage holin [uncultured Tyzzerella sp.]